jgi:hypothetical protein
MMEDGGDQDVVPQEEQHEDEDVAAAATAAAALAATELEEAELAADDATVEAEEVSRVTRDRQQCLAPTIALLLPASKLQPCCCLTHHRHACNSHCHLVGYLVQ